MLSKIGVRTVDVGNAMLSMHSIRETAGSYDVQNAIDVGPMAIFLRIDHLLTFYSFSRPSSKVSLSWTDHSRYSRILCLHTGMKYSCEL